MRMNPHLAWENIRILTGGENNPPQNQRQNDHETQERQPSLA